MGEPLTPLRVALLGCGYISAQYLRTLSAMPNLELVAVADADAARAAAIGRAHGVRVLAGVDALGADEGVDAVVNLTPPQAHHETTAALLRAGKHGYQEKPFALDLAGAEDLMRLAGAHGVRLGVAPDTVLGTGTQTARAAIDEGLISTPIAATATMLTPGHERWHPAPDFYYVPGGGPLLDMGPYYITTLVSLFGTVDKVAAIGLKATEEREIRVGDKAGTTFPVEVPSTMSVLASFEAGQQSNSLVSFDSPLARQGIVEIHGTEGSLVVPDPNMFEGRIAYVKPFESFGERPPEQNWIEVPQEGVVVGRGMGLLDMVRAIAEDRPHVASGELGYHVLDVMLSAEESAASGEFVTVNSSVGEIPLVPVDFDPLAATI